jgi:uncharacterized membrane protein YozB (DUF420 family)
MLFLAMALVLTMGVLPLFRKQSREHRTGGLILSLVASALYLVPVALIRHMAELPSSYGIFLVAACYLILLLIHVCLLTNPDFLRKFIAGLCYQKPCEAGQDVKDRQK